MYDHSMEPNSTELTAFTANEVDLLDYPRNKDGKYFFFLFAKRNKVSVFSSSLYARIRLMLTPITF